MTEQGMQLREDPRSGAEAVGLQPGPATQDAPNHDILKGDAGQSNKRGATSHDRDNNASGKGIE
jgi:hypothetical protein